MKTPSRSVRPEAVKFVLKTWLKSDASSGLRAYVILGIGRRLLLSPTCQACFCPAATRNPSASGFEFALTVMLPVLPWSSLLLLVDRGPGAVVGVLVVQRDEELVEQGVAHAADLDVPAQGQGAALRPANEQARAAYRRVHTDAVGGPVDGCGVGVRRQGIHGDLDGVDQNVVALEPVHAAAILAQSVTGVHIVVQDAGVQQIEDARDVRVKAVLALPREHDLAR